MQLTSDPKVMVLHLHLLINGTPTHIVKPNLKTKGKSWREDMIDHAF